jgi:predicted nucleic acid-binding protein
MILLAKVNLLDVFISSYSGKVIMPEKVRDEVCFGGAEETPVIIKLIDDAKIEVKKIEATELTEKIMHDFNIGAGETEAIILALEEKASLIATDDRNAIRACKLMKIEFTTAISILIRAYEKGLLDREEAMIKLQKLEVVARYSSAITGTAQKLIEGGK